MYVLGELLSGWRVRVWVTLVGDMPMAVGNQAAVWVQCFEVICVVPVNHVQVGVAGKRQSIFPVTRLGLYGTVTMRWRLRGPDGGGGFSNVSVAAAPISGLTCETFCPTTHGPLQSAQ